MINTPPYRPSRWKILADTLVDLAFPRSCVGCQQSRSGGGACLCPICQDHLSLISRPFCAHCGYPAQIEYDYPDKEFLCAACRKQTLKFDRARSFATYESVVKKMIHFFKYDKQPGAMQEIQPLLKSYFDPVRDSYDGFSVTFVPLHPLRLKSRGFDQSYLLARAISQLLDAPLESRWLKRIRETPPQARLSRSKRMSNMQGAFAIEDASRIENARLLIVDDVMTTGATAHEVSKVLKKAGAREVEVFTLARAL